MNEIDGMDISIAPITEEYVASFRDCLDSVARERRYLAILQAPSEENVREYIRENLGRDVIQFVAVDNGVVVGWCDIISRRWEGFTHVGRLGMGVRQEYRGRGIGTRLIDAVLEKAREKGLERIELEVFASNTHARELYRKSGFEVEGVRRKARKLEGRYEDIIFMALLLREKETGE